MWPLSLVWTSQHHLWTSIDYVVSTGFLNFVALYFTKNTPPLPTIWFFYMKNRIWFWNSCYGCRVYYPRKIEGCTMWRHGEHVSSSHGYRRYGAFEINQSWLPFPWNLFLLVFTLHLPKSRSHCSMGCSAWEGHESRGHLMGGTHWQLCEDTNGDHSGKFG